MNRENHALIALPPLLKSADIIIEHLLICSTLNLDEGNLVRRYVLGLKAHRPLSDPEVGTRKLLEIANSIEPVQDDRIHIEKINNWPFLHELNGSPVEYKAALDLAVARGWLWLHESGTYVKFTPAGAELFA